MAEPSMNAHFGGKRLIVLARLPEPVRLAVIDDRSDLALRGPDHRVVGMRVGDPDVRHLHRLGNQADFVNRTFLIDLAFAAKIAGPTRDRPVRNAGGWIR